MAQTTGGMSARSLKVEYDIDTGTGFSGSYTDLSGYGANVEPSGEERAYAEQHTFDGDSPLVGYGKLSAAEATLRAVYTQTDAEAFDVIYDAKKNHYPFKLRWSVPGAATAGDKLYECAGYVVTCTPPGGDAESAETVLFEAKVVGPDFDESTVSE
jgi:hypothetical protein